MSSVVEQQRQRFTPWLYLTAWLISQGLISLVIESTINIEKDVFPTWIAFTNCQVFFIFISGEFCGSVVNMICMCHFDEVCGHSAFMSFLLL